VAEAFVLARYHLYEQVHLHKTTRGMEKLVGKVLGQVASAAASGEAGRIDLDGNDPLVRFFGPNGGSTEAYFNPDDTLVWAAASRMASSNDCRASTLARRLPGRER